MAPSLSAYLSHWGGWSWFTAEIIIHHTLGVIVVLLFIFFNLALTGVVRSPRRLRPYMRSALVLWLVTLAMGLHLVRGTSGDNPGVSMTVQITLAFLTLQLYADTASVGNLHATCRVLHLLVRPQVHPNECAYWSFVTVEE